MQGRTQALARAIGAAAAAWAVLAIAAPASWAGSATYNPALPAAGAVDPDPPPDRTLAYLADATANRLTVSDVPEGIQFSDALATTGCEAACPFLTAGVRSIAIDLGDGDDDLVVGAGLPVASVVGGGGADRADLSQSATAATIAGVEHASGGSANDTLTAGPDGSMLYGLAGSDALNGGPGDDTLVAGDGNDTITAADGVADTISCGPGADTVESADLGTNGVTDLFDGSCETISGILEVPLPGEPGGSSGSSSASGAAAAVLPVPVLAVGVASPRDVTAPAAYLRAAKRQRLATALRRGLLAPVGCAEACGVSVNVLLDRSVARRLDLAGRSGPSVIATATARLSQRGARSLRVRFKHDARRALRGYAKGLTVTLQVLVSDASGNGTLLQRRITLRR